MIVGEAFATFLAPVPGVASVGCEFVSDTRSQADRPMMGIACDRIVGATLASVRGLLSAEVSLCAWYGRLGGWP